ncbi:MAG: serine/threonine-protein kinase [Candidatus Zixiibacteriota bacterium]
MSKGLSSYVLYSLIAVLVICLYLGDFTGLQKLQWKIDDVMYSFRGNTTPATDIVLVNIDDEAIQKYGEWPWSYDVLADLVAICNSAEPKSILLNFDLGARSGEDTLGNTRILANQVSWSKNLVLTYDMALADYSHQRLSKPDYLFQSSMRIESDLGMLEEQQALNVRKPFLPSDMICEYADGLGFSFMEFAPDQKVRWVPVVANYDGFYYPSATLLTSAMHLGFTADDIKVAGGKEITIGGIYTVPTDEFGRYHINYNPPGNTFKSISAANLMSENADLATLKSRMIIVSVTATGHGFSFNTPVSDKMPQPEVLANIGENIVHSNYVEKLDLGVGLNILIILGFGLFCAFILPRVSLMNRMIILGVFLIVLANLNYLAFSSYHMLPRSLYLAIEIILLMIASPMIVEAKTKEGEESKFSLKSLLSFGKKDAAPVRTNASGKVPVRTLKDTGNETEFQRTEVLPPQHNMSDGYDTMAHAANSGSMAPTSMMNQTPPQQQYGGQQPPPFDPNQPLNVTASDRVDASAYHDSYRTQNASGPHIVTPDSTKIPTTGNASAGAIVTPQSASGGVPVDNGNGPVEPPIDLNATPPPPIIGDTEGLEHLGRYKVVGALGKGAMGTVFKGIDPAINRPVALKTIRLDFVADENELNELRDRLFREAQAAGKLSHPNIVTIYDVGSEGSLQYIAMEYLEGQNLEELIKRKVQFSYKILANIIAQICDALDYAHNQGIVHRDIKPANIMVLKDYSVKVMDFGIARVDSSSMTKTGIAMGTPNYIAPELLQGQDVDKRCDIFSLGVVIYELLTGRRPFKGENMTALIYSIIHDNPLPPSTVNPNVPALFDHVVNNALRKNPKERYQKATDIRKTLADFVGSFSSIR